jgi:hypothetical protein
MDLPLCETLSNISSRQVIIPNIKIKHVVADVILGSIEETRIFLEGPLYQKKTIIPQVIGRLAHKQIGWQPWMNIIDVDENISMPRSTDQMPNCDHWVMLNLKDKAIRMEMIRIQTLRQLWHPETHWIKDPPKPPFKIPPSSRLSTNHWKFFWRQKLDHKAVDAMVAATTRQHRNKSQTVEVANWPGGL